MISVPMVKPSVLVVAYDEETRRRWGDWLEASEMDVMACPGPQEPNYVCLGGRGKPCPLAHGADVVVLDLDLASDRVLEGTASWQLLLYYIERDCDVVAVTDGEVLLRWLQDERLLTIPKPSDPAALINAVDQVVGRRERRPAGSRKSRVVNQPPI